MVNYAPSEYFQANFQVWHGAESSVVVNTYLRLSRREPGISRTTSNMESCKNVLFEWIEEQSNGDKQASKEYKWTKFEILCASN